MIQGPAGLLDWYHGTSTEYNKTLGAAMDRAKGNRKAAEADMLGHLARKAMEDEE